MERTDLHTNRAISNGGTMQEQRSVNGVDVDRLNETMETLKKQPEGAKFTFRAVNRWENGAHCVTTIQDFEAGGETDWTRAKPFVLVADEPDVLLGEDHGPNATEAALYALSSCLMTTFIYYAASKGVPLDHVELEISGDVDIRGFLGLSHDVQPGYQHIDASFRVQSEAPQDALDELAKLARMRSPVAGTVMSPTPVSVGIEKA